MIASVLKRSFRLAVVGLVLTVLMIPAVSDTVLAIHNPPCTSPDHEIIYGRNAQCGYFLNNSWNGNQPYTGPGFGLLTGINDQFGTEALFGADNVQRFIDIMRFHLQPNCIPGGGANDDRRRNAAAFIILTMQGAPAGTPANAPCISSAYSFARWESLVRQYDAAGLVDWNPTDLVRNGWYTRNTRILQNPSTPGGAPDPAWYPDPNCNNPLGFCAEPSIIFRAPDLSPLYMIKKNCANPIDIPRPLTPLSHGFTVNPTANAVPLPDTEVPTSARFETGASHSGSPSITTYDRKYFYIKAGTTAEVTIQDPAPVTRTNTGSSFDFPDVTINIAGLGLTAGDRVCARNVVTPGAGTADPSGNVLTVTDGSNTSGDPPAGCFTIVHRPYHQTYGGDTRAGSGFLSDAGVCATDTAAAFLGLNKSGSPDYTGAGSQLAAFAFGWIVDFSSGQLRTNAVQPKPLSFANENPSYLNLGATTYGGGLVAGNAACAPDHYDEGVAEATNALGASTTANLTAGIYSRGSQASPANLTITGGTLGLGSDSRVIYVYGNVTITGNIQYTAGSDPTFNDLDNIPGFRLIVQGNIYVEPGVSRLDGIYIAQPWPDGSRGLFYTCAPGGSPPDNNELNSSAITGCRNTKLTVYGAVIADLIKLARSSGTLGQAVNTPAHSPSQAAAASTAAEVFVMTPEAWLVSDFSDGGEYDSVTTLPPVL